MRPYSTLSPTPSTHQSLTVTTTSLSLSLSLTRSDSQLAHSSISSYIYIYKFQSSLSLSHTKIVELIGKHRKKKSMSNKRPRSGSSIDKAVVDVWQRELGQLSSRSFAHRLGGSEVLSLITLSPVFCFLFVSVWMINCLSKFSCLGGF